MLDEVQLVVAQILHRRGIGRAVQVAGQLPDVPQVLLLSLGGELAHAHVFHHASTQGPPVGKLHAFETRVTAFPPAGLSAVAAADRKILLGQIRSELLSLETIRPLEKNPDVYSGSATNSVYVLMIRKFAPAEVRLQSVNAREKQIPGMIADARQNLKNPPRIYTEIAIQQMPGIVSFFEKDVPLAFADVKDDKAKAEFANSNGRVIAALRTAVRADEPR